MKIRGLSPATSVKISEALYDTKFEDRPDAIKKWIELIQTKTEEEILKILESDIGVV